MRTKRTSLGLDEHVLAEVVRLSGEKTCSAAVTWALELHVRGAEARQIPALRGRGLWEGDLDVPSGRHDLKVLRASRDFSLLARTCPLRRRRITP